MALDEEHRRIFIAARRLARLLVLNMDTGKTVARLSPKVGSYLCFNADVTPGYGVAGIGLHTNKTGSPSAFGVGVVK